MAVFSACVLKHVVLLFLKEILSFVEGAAAANVRSGHLSRKLSDPHWSRHRSCLFFCKGSSCVA